MVNSVFTEDELKAAKKDVLTESKAATKLVDV